jgi:hypothetical protein
MQTGTAKGMVTMEQSLAELILRGVVTKDIAISRSSRPEQLVGLLERAGFDDPDAPPAEQNGHSNGHNGHAAPAQPAEPLFGGLRVSEG